MKRITVIFTLLLLHYICYGVNYNRIEALKRIDDCTISHIYQTQDNAIWIASTDGLLRFEGKNAMPVSFSCPGWILELECGEGRYIWHISTEVIQRANMISLQTEVVANHDINFRGCITMARGDSLFVSINEDLYCCNNDGLYLYGSMPQEEIISSMLDTEDGGFLISTRCGKIYKDNGSGQSSKSITAKSPSASSSQTAKADFGPDYYREES
jgi:ligand-binding sensor domain-containing protein